MTFGKFSAPRASISRFCQTCRLCVISSSIRLGKRVAPQRALFSRENLRRQFVYPILRGRRNRYLTPIVDGGLNPRIFGGAEYWHKIVR